MKRVLVGFDGSEGAGKALNKAMMFVEDDGELIIAAIISLPSNRILLDQKTYERMKSQAHDLINNIIHNISSHNYTITGLVKEGEDIAAVIIDIANELSCDLIVLGSRGSSSLGKFPIGSVANKVVQYAAKPVMVVR